MHDLESWALEHACRGEEALRLSPIDEITKEYVLTPIGSGAFARVYRVGETPWVLKESRWDIALPMLDSMEVSIPGQVFQLKNLFPPLATIQPEKENILREFQEYREFAKYMGYSDIMGDAMRNILGSDVYDSQIDIRRHLDEWIPRIEKKFKFKMSHTSVLAALSMREHNYLPKEYLLLGDSLSPENEGRQTSFILQEFITGRMLHDVPIRSLTDDLQAQFLLFCILLLIMNMESGILPDTRPRSVLLESYDWLTNTDNVVVADRGLIFVDTRWFWLTEGKWWQSGLVIPQLMVYQCKRYLST